MCVCKYGVKIKGTSLKINNNIMNIFQAIEANSLEQVKQFIENGKNINQVNYFGHTLLMRASTLGHLSIVKYLVEVNYESPDTALVNALYNALCCGNLHIVKYLVNRGAKITPECIRVSVECGHYKILKYFYKRGCNIENDIMKFITTTTASEFGIKTKIIKYLIKINSFIKFINIDKNYYLKTIIMKRIKI